MNEKMKKFVITAGSVLVGIMFIASYTALGNNNPGSTTVATTTVASGATYYVTGSANGIVAGYADLATIAFAKNSSSVSSQVGNFLSTLETNGSISNYISQGNGYEVFTGSLDAYQLQQAVYRNLSSNSIAIVNATSTVTLPRSIPLYYRNQIVNIRLPQTNFTVSLSPLPPPNTSVAFIIHAIVFANGTVYNNQISVSRA